MPEFVNRKISGEFGDSVSVENGVNAVYIAAQHDDDTYTAAMFKPDAAEKVAWEILESVKRARAAKK